MNTSAKKITESEAFELADRLFDEGRDYPFVVEALKSDGIEHYEAGQTALRARDSKERVSNTPKEEMKAAVIEAPVSVPVNVPVAEPAPKPSAILKASALAAIDLGLRVFALGEAVKEPDSVESPNGFLSSTNDREKVNDIWTRKRANIGIDCGSSDVCVFDFDVKEDIPEWVNSFRTLKIKTGKGLHVYTRGARPSKKMYAATGKHIGEIKSQGGYVIWDKSVHPSGAIYQIVDDSPIAPTPDEHVAELTKNAPAKTPATINGDKIPRGQHDNELTRIAGRLRHDGMEENSIYDAIVEVCEKRCENYGTDYKEMCRKIAQSVCRYQVGANTDLLMTQQPTAAAASAPPTDVSHWLSMFRSVEEMEDGPIVMVIDGVLQEGTCFIGANPGDGKTLVALAFAKAVSTGTPLFELPMYPVPQPRTVIYLIPESRDRAFRKRCEAFQMPKDKMKFMARTISAGVSLELGDPYLLEAVRQTKAVVFLDTASRFMKGADENAAAQNRQLVNDVIALLAAGAVCVVLIHHATKAAKQNQERMSLENMLRGTSDFGAMCDQAYGIRKDMTLYANGSGPMEIDLVSLKDREQVGGLTQLRLAASHKNNGEDFPVSYINEIANFKVIHDSETYRRDVENLITLVKSDPNIPAKELAERVGLTDYAVKQKLGSLGWHRVQGGPRGASPWHQDMGSACPYAKVQPVENPKSKPGIKDAVAYLTELLAGTAPDGEYIPEAEVYKGADQRGLSDALIVKAKNRLSVVVGDDRGWSLPSEPEGDANGAAEPATVN